MNTYASRAGRWPLALTLAACAALGTGCTQPTRFSMPVTSGRAFTHRQGRTSPNSHTITRGELSSVAAVTAYDLVFLLRPDFLRTTSRSSAMGGRFAPVVYLNGLEAGKESALTTIPADGVEEIRYVSPVDALIRYGPTNAGGVIVVSTRR